MKQKKSLYLVLEQIKSINKQAFKTVINQQIDECQRAHYIQLISECSAAKLTPEIA